VPYSILYTKSYIKLAIKFIKAHPALVGQYEKALKLLELNPFHPSLRLHKLKGKLAGLYSVSINISYRITIEFLIQKNLIVPISVGSHDEAYK
jgi:toxin HigB-1